MNAVQGRGYEMKRLDVKGVKLSFITFNLLWEFYRMVPRAHHLVIGTEKSFFLKSAQV